MEKRRVADDGVGARKKPKHAVRSFSQSATATPIATNHPVLRRLYPHVLTLRHYLLSRLPTASKGRRRRIAQLGTTIDADHDGHVELGQLLDSTLVCSSENAKVNPKVSFEQRTRDIETFTQHRSQEVSGGTFRPGYLRQSEIVDFVVWLLFKQTSAYKPAHLLCHGFQRAVKRDVPRETNVGPASPIPGLVAHLYNGNVKTLKEPTWCRLQALLGRGGDDLMMDLLLECAIFYPISGNLGNYYQLSGMPVSDIKSDKKQIHGKDNGIHGIEQKTLLGPGDSRSLNTIILVRSRMFYAKAALNAKGGVRFGMRHIHVLNRFPDRKDSSQTIHILKYIFPRQFGLHNAFTSRVDPRETAIPFKDYTLREQEIHHGMCKDLGTQIIDMEEVRKWKSRVPKRLRGAALRLVERLRTLDYRCSYVELLRHYCPVEGLELSSKPNWRQTTKAHKQRSQKYTSLVQGRTATSEQISAIPLHENSPKPECFTDMACPSAHVSAFCRAAVGRVMPQDFWASDANKCIIMYWVDQFVSLRRFESITLHQIMQDIQMTDLAWLQPPGVARGLKIAKSDFEKRKQIFAEFIYWLFDGFLIPLIRSNFHVTESNTHRHQLFYFRHDVWRMLTEPSIQSLKESMFEQMPTEETSRLLSMRPLGFSKMRLLPKASGFRIIMNLKRRQQIMRNGTISLGRSINTVMTPVFSVLTHEKSLRPDHFGCSLFSVTEMLPRLASFKLSLRQQRLDHMPIYFAKVDVQSCFDTIPQDRLLSMVGSLMSMPSYRTGKHVEISPLPPLQRLDGQHVDPPPVKRYVPHGGGTTDLASFSDMVQKKFIGAKTNTLFVNTNMQQQEAKDDLMRLLREHVGRNIVKIGKGFYRQKTGIPQGSILSSILCNFFYAELERDVLSFALGKDCLLLRLLDDFILITVNEDHAKRFVRIMHRGHADYGVVVKPSKSLANFDVQTEDGQGIAKITSGSPFPYCGIAIDMKTLEVSKKTERSSRSEVENSLTVDLSKMPGQTFHRKALNAFKIQLKSIFIDTTVNSVSTVLANLHRSFAEAAVRCLEYIRVLNKARTTCSSLLISTSRPF